MTEISKHALPFFEMVERIQRNKPEEFGGAVVLMPPAGDPITFLLNDPNKSEAQFWSLASAKVEIAKNEAIDSKANPGGFPRPMR